MPQDLGCSRAAGIVRGGVDGCLPCPARQPGSCRGRLRPIGRGTLPGARRARRVRGARGAGPRALVGDRHRRRADARGPDECGVGPRGARRRGAGGEHGACPARGNGPGGCPERLPAGVSGQHAEIHALAGRARQRRAGGRTRDDGVRTQCHDAASDDDLWRGGREQCPAAGVACPPPAGGAVAGRRTGAGPAGAPVGCDARARGGARTGRRDRTGGAGRGGAGRDPLRGAGQGGGGGGRAAAATDRAPPGARARAGRAPDRGIAVPAADRAGRDQAAARGQGVRRRTDADPARDRADDAAGRTGDDVCAVK